ncbi:MAG: hypothetical protein ABL934_19220 [Lysobacteraceae bacterium]
MPASWLGNFFVLCAADGVLEILFGTYLSGESTDASFHAVLQHMLYFWAFLKFIELVGAVCLLFDDKPALGLTL